ncbi:hypothetical protein Pint_07551 [Pistacia integerrima]|uniref:Uncharacterized protein n=1 Tax=Pistacia integerrima TaxID=434235 RepID=A0ACC0XVQ7_9ROSI|nr:hypothetical protein Pint_07551 [Pistacia integerrima]
MFCSLHSTRDSNKDIVVFGEIKKIPTFLEEYLGFHHDQLALSTLILILYPLALASLFIYFIGHLNFQRR